MLSIFTWIEGKNRCRRILEAGIVEMEGKP